MWKNLKPRTKKKHRRTTNYYCERIELILQGAALLRRVNQKKSDSIERLHHHYNVGIEHCCDLHLRDLYECLRGTLFLFDLLPRLKVNKMSTTNRSSRSQQIQKAEDGRGTAENSTGQRTR